MSTETDTIAKDTLELLRKSRAKGKRAAVRLALEFILMLVVTFTALHFVGFGAAMATMGVLTILLAGAIVWSITIRLREAWDARDH